MILEDYLEVKPNGKQFQYYKDLGYVVKSRKEFIKVKNEDLPKNSNVLEKIKCDCCGKVIERKHNLIMITREAYGKDLCIECSRKERMNKVRETNLKNLGVEYPTQSKKVREKVKETLKKNYGVDNPMKSKEIQDKAKETNLERYGAENTFASEQIKQKIKETNLENYGVENPMQNEKTQKKAQKTNLKRYGYENPLYSKEVREKAKKTNLEKYGVDNPLKNKEIYMKGKETLAKNGNVPTSKQQLELFKLCKEWFPDYLVELNYPVLSLSLDIKIITDTNILIDLEYDGQYWHQNKKKDFARDCIIKKEGYKIIRIRTRTLLPTKEQLEEAINYVSQDNHTFSQIKLSDWKEENNK